VRAIPALGAPLAGLVLISPAASFTANAASFERNGNKDILTRGTCDYWTQQLHSEGPYWSELAKGGYWGEAVEAPASWWKGVGDVVGRCLITAGSEEVILDDILRFAETMVALKVEKWEVERVLGAGEIHDAPLMDFVYEGKAVGETTQRVKTFMAECWGAGIHE
jgi:acetyl esterase/lipase